MGKDLVKIRCKGHMNKDNRVGIDCGSSAVGEAVANDRGKLGQL